MIVTNSVNDCFRKIFEFIGEQFPFYEESKTGIVFIFMLIIPMLVIYYFSIMIEWPFSLLVYRHKIKIDIQACASPDNIEKWLDANYYWRSKYMNYQQFDIVPFKNFKNEIRFLRKKDATHFKLVWG